MIIWGTRIGRRFMGYAAEFCPSCRKASPMRVVQVRKHAHLYFIPVTRGKPQHFESTCDSCGAVIVRELSTFDNFIAQPDLELAISQGTTPGYEDWLEEREDSEERVLSGEASHDERLGHIADVIASLEYMAQSKASQSSSESVTAVLALLFIVGFFMSAFVASGNMPAKYGPIVYTVTGLMLLLLLYRILVTQKKTHVKVVREHLVNGLLPIDPTREELDTVLRGFRGSKLAKSVDPDDLLIAINERVHRQELP